MSSISEEVKTKLIGSVKWSADNIVTFLETYKNYELLWNVRHSDYANKAKRESSMIKLKGELIEKGVAVPDISFLRARIKAIKTTYRAELLKVSESRASGEGTDNVYVPKLPWFNAADCFLRDVAVSRKSTSNLVTPSTSAKDDGMDEEICEGENQNIENKHLRQPPIASTCQTSSTKKRRINMLSNIDGTIEKLKKITEKRTLSSSNANTDEIDVFGKYIAAHLRELPLKNRLICQEKIQSLLIKERLNLLESPSHFPSVVFSASSSSDDGDSDEDVNTAEGNFICIN